MRCSVVVAAYNAHKTLEKCLNAIFGSSFKDFEVIVVDDASHDATAQIAKKYPVTLISLKANVGAASARNLGAQEAKYDILVFIDSDVVILKETLKKIVMTFESHEDIAACVGVLSEMSPQKNFFSQYKNLYMRFVLNCCPDRIDFIYGSCFSIRKKFYEPYCPTYRFGEDTELGSRLSDKGLTILLDKSLEVIHLKSYTFFSFLRNDFNIPFAWSRLFIEQKKWKGLLERKRVFHARKNQLLSIIVSPFLILGFFHHPLVGVFFFIVFITLNLDFLIYLNKKRGFWFSLVSILVGWIDALVMGFAILSGMVSFFFATIIRRHT
ncbi:MAG: glycosyltransferase [Candidatus Omnitrophica bacterium]|nr:glycosyltransferase [Candidatus Omnitrophota bacterium]MDD5653571.1 glycosyltransferase [Candidatus Omnitrophota bacterium]